MGRLTPSLRLIAKGSIFLILGTIISKVFTLIYRVIVAKYMGPEAYGILSFSLTILSFLTPLALLGLGVGVSRYVSYYLAKEDYQRVKGVIVSSLKIVAIWSSFISVLIIFLSDWVSVHIFKSSDLSLILKIIILTLPFYAITRIIIQIFFSFKKAEYVTITDYIFQSIMLVLVTFILLSLGFNLIGAATSYLLSYVLSIGLFLYLLEKTFPIFKLKTSSINITRELINYSLPLSFSSFFMVIYSNIDTLMIGYFLNMKEVGIYNAALILARLISMVPTFFIPVFLPTIVELYTKKQREEFIQVIKTTSRWIFILGFPLFLIMFLYPSQILTILFGNVFIDGKVSLLLLSIGFLLFSVLGNVNIAILAALKLSRNIFYVTVVMATFDVIANYLLIPKYGISGAAAATLLTYLIGSILFLRLSYRKIGEFSVDAGFFKILISGFIAIYSITFILEYFIPLRTFPVMLISFVLMNILYALLLFFIKAIKDEDREVLLSIIQKIKYLRSRRI